MVRKRNVRRRRAKDDRGMNLTVRVTRILGTRGVIHRNVGGIRLSRIHVLHQMMSRRGLPQQQLIPVVDSEEL